MITTQKNRTCAGSNDIDLFIFLCEYRGLVNFKWEQTYISKQYTMINYQFVVQNQDGVDNQQNFNNENKTFSNPFGPTFTFQQSTSSGTKKYEMIQTDIPQYNLFQPPSEQPKNEPVISNPITNTPIQICTFSQINLHKLNQRPNKPPQVSQDNSKPVSSDKPIIQKPMNFDYQNQFQHETKVSQNFEYYQENTLPEKQKTDAFSTNQSKERTGRGRRGRKSRPKTKQDNSFFSTYIPKPIYTKEEGSKTDEQNKTEEKDNLQNQEQLIQNFERKIPKPQKQEYESQMNEDKYDNQENKRNEEKYDNQENKRNEEKYDDQENKRNEEKYDNQEHKRNEEKYDNQENKRNDKQEKEIPANHLDTRNDPQNMEKDKAFQSHASNQTKFIPKSHKDKQSYFRRNTSDHPNQQKPKKNTDFSTYSTRKQEKTRQERYKYKDSNDSSDKIEKKDQKQFRNPRQHKKQYHKDEKNMNDNSYDNSKKQYKTKEPETNHANSKCFTNRIIYPHYFYQPKKQFPDPPEVPPSKAKIDILSLLQQGKFRDKFTPNEN